MAEIPIICTLTPGELKRRGDELLPGLLARAESVETLEDGVRLRFAAAVGILETITRAIDAERQCCQFFKFQLTVEPALGPIVLDVSGPAGARAFLEDFIKSESTSVLQSSSK